MTRWAIDHADSIYTTCSAGGKTLSLPIPCCNGTACQAEEPDFLKREDFIESDLLKLIENGLFAALQS